MPEQDPAGDATGSAIGETNNANFKDEGISGSRAPLLEARNIRKAFPGTQALDGVNFDLLPGEVHALVGENGAGKSTLVNILSGVIRPDSGEIVVSGRTVHITDPRQAQELGIGTVFQELSLVPALSVAENVFPNRAPTRTPLGLVDWRALYAGTRTLLAPFEAAIDPRTLVRNLNTSARQIVEIAKALSLNARILILDEPTAALSPEEVQLLFRVVRRLRASGLGIVFISHRVREVLDIADRVTVLRDGRCVGTYAVSQLDVDSLIRLMVGRKPSELTGRGDSAGGELLRVESLSGRGFYDVWFVLRHGEILGLAGLRGAGRTELGQALVGAEPVQSGRVWLEGQQIAVHSPADAARLGIGYLPADRKSQGLFLDMTVRDNVAAASLAQFSRWGLVDTHKQERVAVELARRLGIRTPGVRQIVRRLSGGNQQKVMLARWLARRPRILIVDEPTRGIDVGARAEIHHLLRELAWQGVGIMFISSDLTELLALSDRILVMHEGRVTGLLDAAGTSEQQIMALVSRHDRGLLKG